ncbi:hypothetical protein C8R45DRAFT_1072625 [Mycena sanguinolenta]|nr:hypothetical protein C8R45DRAFT_1072625 [Mycena sanguinolenta]
MHRIPCLVVAFSSQRQRGRKGLKVSAVSGRSHRMILRRAPRHARELVKWRWEAGKWGTTTVTRCAWTWQRRARAARGYELGAHRGASLSTGVSAPRTIGRQRGEERQSKGQHPGQGKERSDETRVQGKGKATSEERRRSRKDERKIKRPTHTQVFATHSEFSTCRNPPRAATPATAGTSYS